MNEDCLKDAFGVMERVTSGGILDDCFHRLIGSARTVDDVWAEVEKKIDEQWASVLGDEDRAPADLRTEILKVQLPIDAEILELLGVLQSFPFLIKPKALSRGFKCKYFSKEGESPPFNVVF